MVNKSVVAKSNADLAYPKSLEAMTNKFVSPWVVVISLLCSGRLLSVADQSSPLLPYSESYLRRDFIETRLHQIIWEGFSWVSFCSTTSLVGFLRPRELASSAMALTFVFQGVALHIEIEHEQGLYGIHEHMLRTGPYNQYIVGEFWGYRASCVPVPISSILSETILEDRDRQGYSTW